MKFTDAHEVPEDDERAVFARSATIIRVLGLVEEDSILCSRRTGERYRPALERAAGITPIVILDFAGAEVVTPSFFLGGPWSLWEREQVEQYPIVANLPARALDDIEIVTIVKRTPIWTGRFEDGHFMEPQLIGEPEETDKSVLFSVFEKGSVSATDLAKSVGRLGVTGWNNRLVGLCQRKVLMRTKTGRMYVYSPPWKGLGHG